MHLLQVVALVLSIGLGSLFYGGYALYQYSLRMIPDVTCLQKAAQVAIPLEIYTKDGILMARFGAEFRLPVKTEEIPPLLTNAFLWTEDRRFFLHNGIDPIGIFRALVIYLRTHKKQQGASTITQQLARNLYLSSEKTLIRKVKEIFLALRIERLFSKQEILTLYLNKIYLGHRAYGVAAAAKTYFNKTLQELTTEECVSLAALPKAPSALDPFRFPQRLLERRNLLLSSMEEQGTIEAHELQQALQAPLQLTAIDPTSSILDIAPHAAEQVRVLLCNTYHEKAYTSGFRVITTIDSKLQHLAETALYRATSAYDRRHGYRGPIATLWQAPKEKSWDTEKIQRHLRSLPSRCLQRLIPSVVIAVGDHSAETLLASGKIITLQWPQLRWARRYISATEQGPDPQNAQEILSEGDLIYVEATAKGWELGQFPAVNGAFVSLDPQTGAIQALAGSIDFQSSQFNRVTQTRRQVGSVIKPFIYAAAFERGFTLATLLNDLPITRWSFDAASAWQPNNSPPVYDGPLRVRVGIARSKNVMAVRALRATGLSYVAKYLPRFGFGLHNPPDESIALGSSTASPLELARAYAAIGNGGYLVTPFIVERVEDSSGMVIENSCPPLSIPDKLTPVCYPSLPPFAKEPAWLQEESITSAEIDQAEAALEEAIPHLEPVQEALPGRDAPHICSEEIAFLVKESLISAIYGEANSTWLPTGWRGKFLKRRDVAGKSGTTNESKDAWFSGITPHHIPVIWIGFDDHQRSLGETSVHQTAPFPIHGAESGSKAAQPAWNWFVGQALKEILEAPIPVPHNIEMAYIDTATGERLREDQPNARLEYFIKGTVPKQKKTKEATNASRAKKELERRLFD